MNLPGNATSPPSRRIDIHHHVLPPRYVAARREHGVQTGPGFETAMNWTPDASLDQMDRNGISTAILSNPSNWMSFPQRMAPELARDSNEYCAALRARYPGRFGFFASLPLPDADASLREIEYAFDDLNADGASTTTSFGDKWPSDAMFKDVFAELDRRKAVLFVHPQVAGPISGLTPPVPDAMVEYMFDIVRCIAALLFNGTLTRFPNIRFVFTHGGGGLASLAERIDRTARKQKAVADRLPHGAIAEIQRLHFDLTTATGKPAIAAIRALLPTDRLLLGTDYPFMEPQATIAGLDRSGFTAEELDAIWHRNAAQLFPQFSPA